MDAAKTWPTGSDGRQAPRAFCSSLCTKNPNPYHCNFFTKQPPTAHETTNSSSSNNNDERRHRRKHHDHEHEHEHEHDDILRYFPRNRCPKLSQKTPVAAAAAAARRGGGGGGGREMYRSTGFESLPYDILQRIAGSFNIPALYAASGVCRAWREGLSPLREAMVLVQWGKKFKHGRDGVSKNIEKALDSFLKGAARGCAAAMVDAGLLLWELGRRDEGVAMYRAAADLGDPAGQCNLGLSYLQGNLPNPQEAVKWFYRAALSGNVRAQYSLALCLQQGRGVERNSAKAARWYLRAAEGGSTRAMYNTALCYSSGEGFTQNLQQAKKWMKRAAYSGHRKAQYEHGLTLFLDGDGVHALAYLELASRAGEAAASRVRDVLLQQLTPKSREVAIKYADKWQNSRTSR